MSITNNEHMVAKIKNITPLTITLKCENQFINITNSVKDLNLKWKT
jgi:hypothetical protein